jgi:Glyoxalase-like domain
LPIAAHTGGKHDVVGTIRRLRGAGVAVRVEDEQTMMWEQVVVDAADPVGLGRWWATALEWVVVNDDPEEFEIRPAPDRLPGLLFARVPEPKTIKNRVHLDFRPDDRDAAVARLLGLGATPADVGQREQTWVVLKDPEGNEFCVLQSRNSAQRQSP